MWFSQINKYNSFNICDCKCANYTEKNVSAPIGLLKHGAGACVLSNTAACGTSQAWLTGGKNFILHFVSVWEHVFVLQNVGIYYGKL